MGVLPEDLKLSELLESAAGPALAAALGRRARREWKRERARQARAAGRLGDGVRAVERGGPGAGPAAVRAMAAGGGFDLGQAYEVEVRPGRLVIRAV